VRGEGPAAAFRLDGQVAVVTGASAGLGAMAARALAAAGCAVVCAARRTHLLDRVVDDITRAGGRAIARPADLRDPAHAEALVAAATDAYGRLDGVVLNAATATGAPAEAEPAEAFADVLAVNVTAQMRLAAAAARAMIPRGGGWMILMSSILGRRAGSGAGVAAYCASKGAVEQLTRELARQWAPRGIRVNALAPGYFPTELNAPMVAAPGRLEKLISATPMGRPGEEADIAGAFVFLAAPASRFITGQVLGVDGGMAVW
jgi:NAD(P)-dependent dehydrogenase (short-subunit alcohol dehydrogenase family)